MIFSHSGAMGDIIYHLPLIEYLGGGSLHILPANCDGYRTKEDMQFQSIRRLVAAQPYINDCVWSPTPVGLCFDRFRGFIDMRYNLSDMAANWLGIPCPDRTRPWLTVPAKTQAPVIIARSKRYRFAGFPWSKIHATYATKSLFIGTTDEYADYQSELGEIAYQPTCDLYEAAQLIAGCQLFIGNPSSLMAIAEGLKKNLIVSAYPPTSHAVFWDRSGHQHCWDKVDFWEIK